MKGAMGAAIRQLDLLLQAGSMAGLSDAELLDRVISRDPGSSSVAFEALVRRHGPMVLATCRGVLHHEHDAEDAFQTTFLALARRAGSLRSGDRLGPWLHRVAVRASDRARAEAARRREHEAVRAELAAMAQPRSEWDAEREELGRVIHQEVNRLPARYRLVVVLCDLQSETYETAAARLRVPVGTIRSRLSRARERLRGRIARRGLALPAGAITAALLTSGEASAAVPAHLVASTLKLATASAAGALAAGTASTPAPAYAERFLRAGALIGLGNVGSAVAVVVAGTGIGLAAVGVGVLSTRGRPAARPDAGAAEPSPRPIEPARSPRAAADNRSRPDEQVLQGRWIIIEAEQQGQTLDLVLGDRLVIEGVRFVWTAQRGEPERIFQKGTTRGRLALDPGADPRRLELIESFRTIRAIYRLEAGEDQLRLCVGDPDAMDGPRSFASQPQSRQLLLVLRRDGSGRRRGVPSAPDGLRREGNEP
jgi:RNA polymerase sigma factor (sigma-70 family)